VGNGEREAIMATGDIVGVSIDPDGWSVSIEFEGLTIGGTYNYGDIPQAAKLAILMASPAFDEDNDFVAITEQRIVYGTNYRRKAYPDSVDRLGVPDESVNGSNVIIRIALNEPVCAEDTNITATILSGLYNGSKSASGVPVTNNSTLSYDDAKVIANWDWYDYKQIGFDEVNLQYDDSGYFKLRCQAYQYFGKLGRSVKAVKFTATDQHEHTVSIVVTNPIIETGMIDAIKVIDYVGSMPVETLTQGDEITCNFIAYPWYGTVASIRNTADGLFTRPNPHYSPLIYLNDKTHTYGNVVAVVDSVNGDDATASVVPFASFNVETPPNPYSTIAAASNAIIAFNNANYARNDNGGGIILLRAGNYANAGATATLTTPKCFCVIAPFPGVTREQVSITARTGSYTIGNTVFYNNISWNLSDVSTVMRGAYVVNYNNVISHTGGTFNFANPGIWWVIGGRIDALDQGLVHGAGSDTRVLIRGVTWNAGTGKRAAPFMFTGVNVLSGLLHLGDTWSGMKYAPTMPIITFSKLKSNGGSPIALYNSSEGGANAAIVQCMVEMYGSTSLSSIISVATIANDPTKIYKNILLWNITAIGQRANLFYNDTPLIGVGPVYYRFCSVKNCLLDDINVVTDISQHGGGPEVMSADKIGNMVLNHGCGMSGNVILERVVADYVPKFCGINSIAGITEPINPYFVADRSMEGTQEGDGDYHLQSDSPAIGISYEQLLPYDLDGIARYSGGAAGAYEYGTPSQPTKPKSLILDIQNAIRGILRGIRRGVWR